MHSRSSYQRAHDKWLWVRWPVSAARSTSAASREVSASLPNAPHKNAKLAAAVSFGNVFTYLYARYFARSVRNACIYIFIQLKARKEWLMSALRPPLALATSLASACKCGFCPFFYAQTLSQSGPKGVQERETNCTSTNVSLKEEFHQTARQV